MSYSCFPAFGDDSKQYTIRVEYIHGGSGETQPLDTEIAQDLAEALGLDRKAGTALAVGGVSWEEWFGEGLVAAALGSISPVIPGMINKKEVVAAELGDRKNVSDGGLVIKVGYSAGGGVVLDLTMGRHLAPDVAEDWEELLQRYSRENVGLAVVAVDPYLGRVIPDLELMPLLKAPALNEFLQDPQHHITVVKFGRPVSEVSDAEITRLAAVKGVEWIGETMPGIVRRVLKDVFDDPITLAYENIQELRGRLSKEEASRLTLIDKTTDPLLGELWHEGITESLPAVSEAIRSNILDEEQPSISEPVVNHPPEFGSGELSGSLTINLPRQAGREPTALALGPVSVYDPDEDPLEVQLGSPPRYGSANPSLAGSEVVRVIYQLWLSNAYNGLIQACREHDDLVDDFSVVVKDSHGGETSTSATVTIKVVDVAPPRWDQAMPGDMTVECDSVPTPPATVTASDNCDPDVEVNSSEEINLNGCGGYTGTITRTWTATDSWGHSIEHVQRITVQDTTPPSITAPTDVTVECIADVPAAEITAVTASDSCDSDPAITYEGDSALTDPCGGTITRTYRTTDACGNWAEDTQTITVQDTQAPVLMVPADVTIECDGSTDPTKTGWATATDNCDPNPTIVYSDQVNLTGCGSYTGTITRTWAATDDCGNFTTGTQQITVQDTTPPVVNCPGNITVETHDPNGTTVTFTVTATDNCDPNPSVTCTPTSGDHFPVGTTTVTCLATDACSNVSAPCSFKVTVNFINHPPVAYGGSYMVFCFGAATHITLQAEDPDGDPLTYTIVTGPQHGFLQGTPPNLLYFANGPGDCCGCPDSFTFKATDGKLDSNVATISIFIDP